MVVGKPARLQANAAASDLSFDQQCRHCEKVCFDPLACLLALFGLQVAFAFCMLITIDEEQESCDISIVVFYPGIN